MWKLPIWTKFAEIRSENCFWNRVKSRKSTVTRKQSFSQRKPTFVGREQHSGVPSTQICVWSEERARKQFGWYEAWVELNTKHNYCVGEGCLSGFSVVRPLASVFQVWNTHNSLKNKIWKFKMSISIISISHNGVCYTACTFLKVSFPVSITIIPFRGLVVGQISFAFVIIGI